MLFCFLLKYEDINLSYTCNCCNGLPLFMIECILNFLVVLCIRPSTSSVSLAWLDCVIIQIFFCRKTLQVLFSYNLIFLPLSLPTSLLPFLFMLLRHLFISRISTTFTWASLVAQQMHWIFLQCRRPGFNPWVGKNLLERSMATHSSALAWRVTWTEEPDSWQSIGSHGIRHDRQLSNNSNIFTWFKI